jgi:hypothetical protein
MAMTKLIAGLLLLLSSAALAGEQTSFRDRNGYYAGSAIRNSDGSTSYYDRNGHFTGSSTRRK